MKKWLIGMACVGMLATAAMGQVATLPTTWSGPWTNANLPVGWTNVGLGVDYSGTTGGYDATGGGAARFDSAGDRLTLNFDSAPGNVTYWARLNVGSNAWTTNVFSLQESANGTDWSDVIVYDAANPIPITAPTGPYTSSPSASARYLRFNYVQKGNGNVGIDGVTIASGSGVTPTNVKFYASSAAVNEDQGTVTVTVYKTLAEGNVSGQITLSGTATEGAGADYTVDTTNFTMNGATTSATVTVTINDDAAEEGAETVVIGFANVVGAGTTAPTTFTLTINASDQTAYGIAITPPVNGTVTTTPADEAIAGTTVVINATPAGGFAVDSITVTDADAGNVTVSGNTFTMPAKAVTVAVMFKVVVAEGIVDFRFNAAPYLQVTVKDDNLAVSDMALTTGTIETNITTGTYFTDEPYIEETGGWGVSNQLGAKAFQFTITPAVGAAMTINSISFKAYTTSAGPSAYGIDVGGLATYSVDAPSAALLVVSQAVAGVVSQTGAIVVKIQGWANGSRETAGTGAFRLDDVVIHGSVSTGPVQFSVNFDKTEGFQVEEGTATILNATAANGTPPYAYGWNTDMASGDYLVDSNSFGISGLAAVGSYFATVTATDSSAPAQVVSNTIHFSVVAPPTKYAISIVTNAPENGTVTTTPATEAAAGTAVTVNATPAGGYAVESIVVNGGAVTVNGNTFTMPAGPATVTVTFAVSETPDALIDFETYAGTYALTNYVAGGVTWTMTNTYAGNSTDDRKNDTKAARMENNRGGAGHPAQMTSTAFAQPVTKISFWYANYSANDGGKFKVQVSDDGSTWQDVGEAEYDPVTNAALVKATIETIPASMTYVQFVTTAGSAQRVNVDDIGIFFGAPVLGVTLNKSNGFTVNQGSSDAITATAANGTGPYTYAWTSTLGASYCTTNGNLFTILSTAPTGSYSATVTATDAALATAQRTVTFSVVGVNPVDPAVLISGSLSGTVGVEMALSITVTNEIANDWTIDLKDPDGLDDYSYHFDVPPAFTLTPAKTGTYVLTATADTGSGLYSNVVNLTVSGGGSSNHWSIGNSGDGSTMSTTSSNITIVLPTNYTLNAVYGSDASGAGLNNLGQGLGPLPGTDYTWTPATRTVTILNTVTNRRFIRIGANPP